MAHPRPRQLTLFETAPAAAPPRGPRPAPHDAGLAPLAAALPPRLRLGTSSWSFPGWQGLVYEGPVSAGSLARHGLAAYARHPLLRCVGVDRTYYGPVEAQYFRTLAAQVPDDFRFVVKADERCTLLRFGPHPRHGDARGTMNPLFLDSAYAAEKVVAPLVDGLGEKAGVLVFQFPPQDLRPAGGAARFVARLGAFLEALPRGPRYGVEIRNADVFGPDYAATLAAVSASPCIAVHPSMPEPGVQAAVLAAEPPPVFVCRWMLRRDLGYEEAKARFAPFDRLQAEDVRVRTTIARLAASAVRAGRDAYVTVNNKAEGSAPLSIARLAAAIAAEPAG
jgi:uncharacterized protein YecE (DUF72 family)